MTDIEDGHDIGMAEGGDGARFPLEPARVLPQVHYLDGDRTVQPRILRAIHLAHATGAEKTGDPIRSEDRTGAEHWFRLRGRLAAGAQARPSPLVEGTI